MAGLRVRRREPEIMDQPGIDPAEHERALAALARINLLSNTASVLFKELARFQRDSGRAPLRVLDVACGGGDVAGALAQKARGRDWKIEGCDLSPVALERARRRNPDVAFFSHDALAQPIPPRFDVVLCTLFLHHLEPEQATAMLAAFTASGAKLVLVSDLERSRAGLLAAQVVTRLVTRSPIVHFDGPVSVRAAFTPDEALELARQAGMVGATVARRWPFRWLLSWRRP